MEPSPAWQTSRRGHGAGLGQNSFRPLAGPAAQAASPCGGDGCCFDTATVAETIVLYIAFVKQCDQPGAPTGVPGQEPCLDSYPSLADPKPMQPSLRTPHSAPLEATRTLTAMTCGVQAKVASGLAASSLLSRKKAGAPDTKMPGKRPCMSRGGHWWRNQMGADHHAD